MTRPFVLISNILAWLLGVSIAFGSSHALKTPQLQWGFTVMILASASVHYVNEYADHETDSLTTRTMFSGGSGVLPSGLVSRDLALKAGWATMVLAFITETYLVYEGFHPLSALLVLALGTIGGWMYSLKPLKLAWRGLGEVDNAFLGGVLLPLHGYVVASGRFEWWVVLACLPFFLMCFNNLLVVMWPDRLADAKVGKMTLATLWSEERLRLLYGACAATSFTLLLLLTGSVVPFSVFAASLLSLPLVLHGYSTYTRNEVSSSTVYAMVVVMIAQSIAWIAQGF